MAPRADEPRPDPGRGSLRSVVVLASADGAARGTKGEEDHTNDQQDDSDGLQYGDARDQSDDPKHDSEGDHRVSFPVAEPPARAVDKEHNRTNPTKEEPVRPKKSPCGRRLPRRAEGLCGGLACSPATLGV